MNSRSTKEKPVTDTVGQFFCEQNKGGKAPHSEKSRSNRPSPGSTQTHEARYSASDAKDALTHCDPGEPRAEWFRSIAAAKAAGLTIDDVTAWSAGAPNFTGERDVFEAWKSVRPDGGIGPGTLFKKAIDAGWKPRQSDKPSRAKARVPKVPPRAALAHKERPPHWPVAKVWGTSKPASSENEYVVAKRGTPVGLRECVDAVRIGGADMRGALVVPIRSLAGELVSLQFIPATGPKMNLPGHPMHGGVYIVGTLLPDGLAYVVEGIGQAWACWQATGHPAVVSFGWGRVQAVVRELRELYSGLTIVVVPDSGKESEARQIADEIGCEFVSMPEGSPSNFDANDYSKQHGAGALKILLTSVHSQPATALEPRFKLMRPEHLRALRPLNWRVRGVLPAAGVAALYGHSGSGKSFLGLDLAAAIAGGMHWFGHRVTTAPVVYVALEGEAGFRLRTKAWESCRGRDLPDKMQMVMQQFTLIDRTDVEDLAAVVPAGATMFVDTLNRSAPAIDENSSLDMGRVLEGAKRLQALTDGLLVLIHHSGKDSTKGLRGHSSLVAAMDACIEVWREGDRREWRVVKSKDGVDGCSEPFRLQVEMLGHDEHGDPITSCTVVRDTSEQEVHRIRLPQGGNQKLVLDVLRPLIKGAAPGNPGSPQQCQKIELGAAIDFAAGALDCEPKRKNERARDAITRLAKAGVLCIKDGWVWLP